MGIYLRSGFLKILRPKDRPIRSFCLPKRSWDNERVETLGSSPDPTSPSDTRRYHSRTEISVFLCGRRNIQPTSWKNTVACERAPLSFIHPRLYDIPSTRGMYHNRWSLVGSIYSLEHVSRVGVLTGCDMITRALKLKRCLYSSESCHDPLMLLCTDFCSRGASLWATRELGNESIPLVRRMY